MAYREPFFVFEHYLRDAGNASVTLETSGELAAFPKFRLLDNDPGPVFKWDAAAVNNAVVVDRGAGVLFSVDYIIIPSGHNLTGNVVFSSKATEGGSWVDVSNTTITAGQFEWATGGSALRYIRFKVDSSIQGEIPELFMARLRKPVTAGPDPSWNVVNEPNIQETVLRSGKIYRLETGNARQQLTYTFRSVDATDIAVFDDLETQTRTGLYPFWFFPPDTGDAARYVSLGSAIQRSQSSSNPYGTGQKFDVTVSMVEMLP